MKKGGDQTDIFFSVPVSQRSRLFTPVSSSPFPLLEDGWLTLPLSFLFKMLKRAGNCSLAFSSGSGDYQRLSGTFRDQACLEELQERQQLVLQIFPLLPPLQHSIKSWYKGLLTLRGTNTPSHNMGVTHCGCFNCLGSATTVNGAKPPLCGCCAA
ncbi:dnaJ-like protein subfamily C member 13 [Platysternon megacephalum]|uniref:DnaJ-like protein subfamily C member 13 n=1 Tax=Platysternon megacephalum TaxID=55544 RepID=A0A4D9ES89_9SAUR|nr:dnaJ-like protein subfamily C member 13 [Platysternon megacephalum]